MRKEKERPRIIGFARHSQAGHYGILLAKSSLTDGFPLHQHDFFEFEILTEGELVHTVDGRERTVSVGDFHVLSPTSLHKMSGTAQLYNISVYLPDAPPAITELVRRFHPPVGGHLDRARLSEVMALYDMLFRDARGRVAYEKERVSALVLYILTVLLEAVSSSYRTDGGERGQSYLLLAMEYIQEHYSHPLGLSEVAGAVGVSAGYLSSLFSEKMQFGVKEYLTSVRIRHAMSLLATTEKSVTEIAFACGFGSFSNFERSFRRENGCSPLTYRRSMRGTEK